ncbi:MAG: glycosyltransferase family 39 protein [Pseudomonadota bacterium]
MAQPAWPEPAPAAPPAGGGPGPGNAGGDGLAGWCLVLTLAALFLGLGLRFWGLTEQGITSWDGALYANVARTPAMILDWLREHGRWLPGPGDLAAIREHLAEMGAEYSAQKAGHLALLALGFLVFGLKDYAPLTVSALCGFGALALTWRLGRRFFGPLAAVIAVTLLAVSVVMVGYSRSAYPQVDTALAFLAAFYCYLASLPGPGQAAGLAKRPLLFTSLFLGIAATLHPSLLSAAGLLLMGEAWLFISAPRPWPWRLAMKRLGLLACLAPWPALMVEALMRAALGNGVETTLGYFVRGGDTVVASQFRLSLADLWFFPNNFWHLEGPAFALLVWAGLAWTLWRFARTRQAKYLVLAGVPLGQMAFWSLAYTTLKTVTVVYPLLALAAGLLGQALIEAAARRRGPGLATLGLVALVGLLAWAGGSRSAPVLQHQNGYRPAVAALVDYMAQNGGTFALYDQSVHAHPPLRFYLGLAKAGLPDGFPGRISFQPGVHGDYLFINDMWLGSQTDAPGLLAFMAREKPVVTMPHLQRFFLPIFKVHRTYLRSGWDAPAPLGPARGYIWIFDKRKLSAPPGFRY